MNWQQHGHHFLAIAFGPRRGEKDRGWGVQARLARGLGFLSILLVAAGAQAQMRGPSKNPDFDGNGRTDFAIFRPSDGTWWVKDVVANVQWGLPGDLPVPGDYNGDGKTDLAIYRPSDGTWWVKDVVANVQWGLPGDVPVPGDYNGDGKTDFAIYRPSDGTWWVRGVVTVQWGLPGDIPVQGDYNGDGKTDFAIYRPSDGTWWVRGVVSVQWGLAGDIPVQGDYNGDGRADFAVYRPSDGTWWVKDVVNDVQWGVQGDIPLSDLTGKSPRPLISPRILTPDAGAVLNIATPSASVSWAPVPGVGRYLVRLRDDTTGTMSVYDDAFAATQISVPLVAAHAYTFWIHSARADFSYEDPGSFGEASSVGFSTSAAPQLPPPQILSPAAGAVFASGTQSVTATWAPVPGVGRFLVRLRDDTTGAMVAYDDAVTGTEITAAVVAGHAYSFWIHSASWNFSYQDPKSYGAAAAVAFSVARPNAANDATVVAAEIPTDVGVRDTFTISVTVRNTGTTTWSPQSGYRLGSWNPMDDMTWGSNRQLMAPGASVAPGGSYTFRGSVTAPSSPGTYTMQWRMLQEGLEWFGGTSPLATVLVRGPGTHTLSVSKAGTGSGTVVSSPAGISCGSTCSAGFAQGTAVTLQATPLAGSVFTGWSGACAGTGGCAVTMSADQSLTASFAPSAGSHREHVTVRGEDGHMPPGTTGTLVPDNGTGPYASIALYEDRLTFVVPAQSTGGAWLYVSADGYDRVERRVILHLSEADLTDEIHLVSSHVDPTSVSLQQLAAIRGAMWTTRWDGAYGPRPGRPDNILATVFYEAYEPSERQRMLEIYKSRGYTHAVTGPLAGGDCYHGQFPCRTAVPTQAEFDAYLDTLQEWWDAGIIPIHFAKPDNWSLADMEQLDQYYRQPRAQKLLRVVVYTGWEPTRYGWSNATWVRFLQHAAELFPNALRLVHTVADVDALVGEDENGIDTDRLSNAESWHRVTPYLHGWLVQLGAFECPACIAGNGQTNFQNFKDIFNPTLRGSYTDRFQHGYAGWPTFSAWGQNQPLRVYAGEYAAYWSYWNNRPEAEAQDWGDAAMAAGADGYLDGGRVAVPVR